MHQVRKGGGGAGSTYIKWGREVQNSWFGTAKLQRNGQRPKARRSRDRNNNNKEHIGFNVNALKVILIKLDLLYERSLLFT